MGTEPAEDYPFVQCRRFLTAGLTAGQAVLDVGCGRGELMRELADRGCVVSGVEIDRDCVAACVAAGLAVVEGRAEQLPVADASVDAVVCSVVLPYADERRSIAEWARVLRPGGVVRASYHGLGYAVGYVASGPGLGTRVYGLRMLANTACRRLTGRRLPGFWGDTACQTPRRLLACYRAAGLTVTGELVVGRRLGQPVFLCHELRKPAAGG